MEHSMHRVCMHSVISLNVCAQSAVEDLTLTTNSGNHWKLPFTFYCKRKYFMKCHVWGKFLCAQALIHAWMKREHVMVLCILRVWNIAWHPKFNEEKSVCWGFFELYWHLEKKCGQQWRCLKPSHHLCGPVAQTQPSQPLGVPQLSMAHLARNGCSWMDLKLFPN